MTGADKLTTMDDRHRGRTLTRRPPTRICLERAPLSRIYLPIAALFFLLGFDTARAEGTMPDLHKLDRPEILRFIFYPRQTERTPPPAGTQDIDFSMADNVRIGCRLHRAGKYEPVILYFHGNGETVADYDDIGPFYTGQNLNLLICNYRGYGWSGGTPSVGGMISDGRAIYRKAREWLAQNGWTGNFLIMGRSLGSASAIDLAAEYGAEIDGLIIESGFAETIPLAAKLGVDLAAMDLTEEDGFNNIRKIESVTKPTLILHGQRDTLIPLGQAQKLHAAAGAKYKELQIVPGADHNSVIMTGGRLYFETIRRFADKAAGTEQNRWRNNR